MMKKRNSLLVNKISEDEVIEIISNECCNGDKQKGKRVYEEAVKTIKENSGQ